MPKKKSTLTSKQKAEARTERFIKSNARKGLVQSKVWVPANRVEDLKKLAAKWRNESQG